MKLEVNTLKDFFRINARHPQNNGMHDSKDTKISEAIYTIFPMENKDVIMSWGDEDIRLSYRYDIATIIDEIIEMVFTIQNKSADKWKVVWASNTFAGEWCFKRLGDSLEIDAKWREEFVASDYLKSHNIFKVNKNKFLRQWKFIIDILIDNLKECGYSCDNLIDMSDLIKASRIIHTETKHDLCIFIEYKLCDLFKQSNSTELNDLWCDGVTFETMTDDKTASFTAWIGKISNTAGKQEQYKLFLHLGEASLKLYLDEFDIKLCVLDTYQADNLSVDPTEKEIYLNLK